MAIKDPDIREHNNPKLAEIDSNFVRGGGRVVTNLTALYALSDNIDQLKERVTKVWVTSENKNYILKNISDISDGLFNPSAWEIEAVNEKMTESEYTGETGTKKVNYAKSADEAEQAIHSYSAQQDELGRIIHETYALKQSGVTPSETARVILDDDTPTYSIVALTAENLIVENNATEDGEILAPVLAADKTLKITIQGKDTLLNGNTYEDGVTIFGIYEASTETWTFNSILDPEVPDYSDMTVDVMVDNPTITPKPRYIRITGHVWTVDSKVFLRTTDTPTPIGIYQCVGAGAGYSNLELIAAGTALHTVRVKDGDVWYSQYDGENAGTLLFERITVEKLAITKQGYNGELSPVVYPVDRQRTVIGYKLGSNATDFSVTINSVNYTKADVTNVVVPVNTEIKINDVTIAVGKDTGNVVLILK